MEHEVMARWEFMALACLILSTLTLFSEAANGRANIYRMLKARILPYVAGITPAAALVFMLYFVSEKL